MNTATRKGQTKLMRDWLVESDCYLDCQAYILRPDVVFEISREVVKTQDPYSRTLNVARITLDILQRAIDKKELLLEERELTWIDMLRGQLDEIPQDEEEFIAGMKPELDKTKYIPQEYGI
jgi:methanol--5-hydroxybenzimidazolylcobamide Co-methyltransferase